MSNDADETTEDGQEIGLRHVRDDGLAFCYPTDTTDDDGDPFANVIAQFRADSEELGEHMGKLIKLLSKPEYKKATVERFAEIARSISEVYETGGPWQVRQNMFELAEAWRIRAAELGDVWALYNLACREAEPPRGITRPIAADADDTENPTKWLYAAFDAVLLEFGKPPDDFQKADRTEKLLDMASDLIRWRHRESAKEGCEMFSKMLAALAKASMLERMAHELKPLRDEILPTMPGLRVLDGISPSGDKYIKWALEKYQPLCDAPTPLAPVPDDLAAMKNALDDEFPWFAEVTAWVMRQLSIRSGGEMGFKIPPLLLLGDPGVGKTRYAYRLSELSRLPFMCLGLAGKTDNRDLSGTARGWSSGHPGRVIALINERKVANPIVLLDEIDKTGGSDHNGRIRDTLLTLFEPSSAVRVYDDFLWGHADLSRVTWIATANSTATMPTTLLDRVQVKVVPQPKKEHYPAIVKRALGDYLRNEGLNPGWIPSFTESQWKWLGKYFKSPRQAKRATEMLANHLLTQAAGQPA